jgi:glycosyltransferase involved in cell wall biosynthesis
VRQQVLLDLQINRVADSLPWRLAKHFKRVVPPRFGHYFVFNEQPLIALIPEDTYDDEAHWRPFFHALRNTNVHFVCLIRGAVEADPSAYELGIHAFLTKHLSLFPKHAFTFLANNPAQVGIFERARIPHLFVNQNALADESTFRVLPGESKQFDAIYNAVCAPFKRHGLARDVDNLALVTYFRGGQPNDYFREHARLLADAAWLNYPDDRPAESGYRHIESPELCQWLNRSRTGLCLSEREGAMFASIEYLLSGVPVVTTPSIGGRDVFFNDDCALTVPAEPAAVAAGVREMAARRLDPHAVRARTLQRMAEHRRRLVDFIVRTAQAQGVGLDEGAVYACNFPQPIYKPRPMHSILRFR